MYLVLIECEISENKTVFMPKIESIQAFEYQLRSGDWSVLDFVPVKGSSFEIHFGGNGTCIDGSERSYVAGVLTDSAKDAILLANNLTLYFEDGHGNSDYIKSDEPFGLALYIDGETECDGSIEIKYL